MKTKAWQRNQFLRIITIPIRALGKARDFYVRSMIGYASKVGNGSGYMGTTSANYSMDMPRSFSLNALRATDNEDLRELIRAASLRSMADGNDINYLMLQEQMMRSQQQQHPGSQLGGVVAPKEMPPRSQSVGMGRIDEEKPYAAAGEISRKSSKKSRGLFPRSKSYAVNKKGLVL